VQVAAVARICKGEFENTPVREAPWSLSRRERVERFFTCSEVSAQSVMHACPLYTFLSSVLSTSSCWLSRFSKSFGLDEN